jgi:hypothetical protein
MRSVCSDYTRGLVTGYIVLFYLQLMTTLHISLLHTLRNVHSHVFTSRCLVSDPNNDRFYLSEFPNCPRASATLTLTDFLLETLYISTQHKSALARHCALQTSLRRLPILRSLKLKLIYDRQSVGLCLGVGLLFGAYEQIIVFYLTIVGFLVWGTLSDERMGL